MTSIRTSLFNSVAVIGFISVPAVAASVTAPAVSHASSSNASAPAPKLPIIETSEQARNIILKSNRAADDFFIAGLINKTSPNGTVDLGTTKLTLGLSQEKCISLRNSLADISDMGTYKLAQDFLINSGHTTPETAARAVKTQQKFFDMVSEQAPSINQRCKELGIQGVEFAPRR